MIRSFFSSLAVALALEATYVAGISSRLMQRLQRLLGEMVEPGQDQPWH